MLAGVHLFGLINILQLPVAASLGDALLSWITLGFIVFMVINTLSFYHPKRGGFLLVFTVPLILAFAWQQFILWLLEKSVSNETFLIFLENSAFYRLSVSYLILVGAFLFALLWYRLGEREDAKLREQETNKLAKEAELFKLRQQLQPHFLFNSLNSINSLIGSKPALAREMVQQLSSFLRGTLRRDDQMLIPLSEELDHLKLYLDIEEVRFGNRLTVVFEVDGEHLKLKVPPLILQPIMENAIKFGLYGTLGNIIISLKSEVQQNRLHVIVVNPFDEDAEAQQGTGFGLKSVKRRLQLLYGQVDLLSIKEANQTFEARIKIPIPND